MYVGACQREDFAPADAAIADEQTSKQFNSYDSVEGPGAKWTRESGETHAPQIWRILGRRYLALAGLSLRILHIRASAGSTLYPSLGKGSRTGRARALDSAKRIQARAKAGPCAIAITITKSWGCDFTLPVPLLLC